MQISLPVGLELTDSPAYLGLNGAFLAVPILVFSRRRRRGRPRRPLSPDDRRPDRPARPGCRASRAGRHGHRASLAGVRLLADRSDDSWPDHARPPGLRAQPRAAAGPAVGDRAELDPLARRGRARAVDSRADPGRLGHAGQFLHQRWQRRGEPRPLAPGARAGAVPPRVSTRSPWQGLAAGARYIWEQPSVRGLLLATAGISRPGRSYTQLMPLFARDVLHVGPTGLGCLLTMPVGTILAALGLRPPGAVPRKGRLFLAASIVLAITLAIFAASTVFLLSLGVLVLVGIAATASTTLANTLVQEEVADRVRGRVMGFYMAATQGMTPLGALPGGLLAELFGGPFAVGLGAGCAVTAADAHAAHRRRPVAGLGNPHRLVARCWQSPTPGNSPATEYQGTTYGCSLAATGTRSSSCPSSAPRCWRRSRRWVNCSWSRSSSSSLQFSRSTRSVRACVTARSDFVELELDGPRVTVLAVLNEEDHQKGHDRRARVDHKLPVSEKPKIGPVTAQTRPRSARSGRRTASPRCRTSAAPTDGKPLASTSLQQASRRPAYSVAPVNAVSVPGRSRPQDSVHSAPAAAV